MKNSKKVPTARLCDILSWVVAASGIIAAAVYLGGRPLGVPSVVWGSLIFLGFCVAAVLIRILGIIGQALVDSNVRGELLKTGVEHMGNDVLTLRHIVEQVNCDTRDMNQHIAEIRTFFEQIQKQLNLKK